MQNEDLLAKIDLDTSENEPSEVSLLGHDELAANLTADLAVDIALKV